MKPCNRNIQSTLQIVEEMIRLADKGDAEREDVGCGILYGILRDAAFKLKQVAEKEKKAHIRKGWWGNRTSSTRKPCGCTAKEPGRDDE